MTNLFPQELQTHTLKSRDWLILILILIVAGMMRLGEPNVVEFSHHDAMLSTLAQEMVRGQNFPLTGIISSVGIPNPPMSVYTMAIPFAINSNPTFAILFVMLLNVAGVGILWWITHRYFGRTTALIAGFAYALSPWAILYSRKIWAQDFHTPFVLLAFALALYGWEQSPDTIRRKVAQIFALPILIWALQIHFAAWLILPAFFVWLVVRRQYISLSLLGMSFVLTLLVLLPYLIGLTQTLESDPTRISDAVSRSDASTGLSLTFEPIQHFAYLVTGFGLETWVAPEQQPELLANVPSVSLWWLNLLSFFIGVGFALYMPRYRTLTIIFLLWTIAPFFVFIPTWTPVYPHYFVASLPIMAIFIAIPIKYLTNIVPLGSIGRVIILSSVALILLTQGIWWRGLVRYVDTTHIDYPGFTTPMTYLLPIQDALQDSDDVIIVSHGMAWDRHHESVVWDVMLEGQVECVRTVQGDGYAVLPDGAFSVLIAPDSPPNAVNNLYIQSEPEIFPERNGGGEYQLYHFDSAPEWNGEPIISISPNRFDNGVELIGYALTADQIVLSWRLPTNQRGRNYQFSAQLFDADEQRVGQHDSIFWQNRHWCQDDTLIIWGNINISDTPQRLAVSLYQLGQGEELSQFLNANVLDDNDNIIGQSVEIDLP